MPRTFIHYFWTQIFFFFESPETNRGTFFKFFLYIGNITQGILPALGKIPIFPMLGKNPIYYIHPFFVKCDFLWLTVSSLLTPIDIDVERMSEPIVNYWY